MPREASAAEDASHRCRARTRALAETKGIRVTQLALAWLLAQGDDIDARGMR